MNEYQRFCMSQRLKDLAMMAANLRGGNDLAIVLDCIADLARTGQEGIMAGIINDCIGGTGLSLEEQGGFTEGLYTAP